MYDHIIVPFDGTPRALGASLIGADLSRMFEARLVVLTASGADTAEPLRQLKERAMEMSDESVDIWIEGERRPAKAIGVAASYRPHALICMATHARSGVSRMIFGSVAEKVIRRTDEPVVLLGPECDFRDPADLRQVILCLDSSPTAESAVPLAATWASTLGLRCLLMHVAVPREKPSAVPDLDRYEETLGKVCHVERLKVDAEQVVDGIVDVARHATGSILVMATHGRRGFDRFRHGSTVADVVRHSPVPVLVQRGDLGSGLDDVETDMDEPPGEPT